MLKKKCFIFILALTIVITFLFPFHQPVQASIKKVPSNYRENARRYAYEYWNKITDDGKYAVWLGKGTNFRSFITGAGIDVESGFDNFRSIPIYHTDFRKAAYSSLNDHAINVLKRNNIGLSDWISNKKFNPPIELPDYNGPKKYYCPDEIIWNDANDCAHFISNCIGVNGGGIPLDSYYPYAYGQTSASKLAQWIIDNNYAEVYYNFDSQKPQIGDVIIWKKGSGRHTTVVISNEGGLAFHTRGSYNEKTYESFPTKNGFELAYFFHFIPEKNEHPPDDDLPDLICPRFRWEPSVAIEDEFFTIEALIKNVGDFYASSSKAKIYISLDNDFDIEDDYYLATKEVKSLYVNEETWISYSFNFPNANFIDGWTDTYECWLICVVDSDDEVYELNEAERNIWKCNTPITVYE